MDTIVQNKKPKYKIILLILVGILTLSALLYSSVFRKKTLNVDASRISIREVKEGKFDDIVILNGKIEALNSALINVVEGGAVQDIFVEDGAMVTKGQPLVRLYNPNTELGYLQQETAIIEQINNLKNLKISLTNQELELEKELILIQHDFTDAEQQYELDKRLFQKEIIPEKDYNKSLENFNYQSKRKSVIQTSVKREKQARVAQISSINQALEKMERNLDILRDNKKNFLVLANASGRLSSFDPSLGKHINAGESLGKIDIMDGYKITAKVDEYYISRLKPAQSGTIESSGKTYGVMISKVLPEVKDGQFQVELVFKNEVPADLKIGMSFSVKLFLSESSESLLVAKGAFYQETAGKWIFVLDGDKKAVRREIKLGRENPVYYEVTEGLKAGDRVITSSYEDYKNVEVLELKD
ncbi:MAG: HlyD family efflux transporter periplasmic adaptor subunit [Weeksellaceae bacterium]|jgi:HlyD family secretion protein|nr:HlyD family efflux transporter periplasmic adaptor subunit [Weeksellaceae bacterium]MDX9705150.1 HlyD family efflux transporter periplasmic adaptor subunit [Weeksellaceae bacterium]